MYKGIKNKDFGFLGGVLAQLVERVLRMHEIALSILKFSSMQDVSLIDQFGECQT